MKKIYCAIILLTFLVSCAKKEMVDLKQLNGYWEIEKVVLPNGSTKEYTISQSIDFITVQGDSIGYRKKLQPRLDGTFLASNDAEKFSIILENNNYSLQYKNSLSEWKEHIIKLNEFNLIVINEDNLKYFYKRYESLNLSKIDGQEE